MKIVYVTAITAGFAHQALVLARSLLARAADAEVLVYCLDGETPAALGPVLPDGCRLVGFEAFAPDLLHRARDAMPVSAFCWLAKSFALAHAQEARPDAVWACFVDADMMAFADPAERFAKAGRRAVLLNPHAFRYPPFFGTEHLFGHYNAGCIAFRNDGRGREILGWWQARCVEHCPPTPEPDAFGDQKYLDELAHLFREEVSSGFPFTDCAAWNIGRETVTSGPQGVAWQGQTIYLYHFQGLRLLQAGWTDLYAGEMRLSRTVRRLIYRPYVAALRRAVSDIAGANGPKPDFALTVPGRDLLARRLLSLAGTRNVVRWRHAD